MAEQPSSGNEVDIFAVPSPLGPIFEETEPQEIPELWKLSTNISHLNLKRLSVLHGILLRQQIVSEPSDTQLEHVPLDINDFMALIIDRALTDFIDNDPNADEITRSALVLSGIKPPEGFFDEEV